MSNVILYTTDDGKSGIQPHAQGDTVWLSQQQMAELFDATKQNISLHLKNLYTEGEIDEKATVKDSFTVQMDSSREVRRTLKLYNLEAILAVGYRWLYKKYCYGFNKLGDCFI